MAISETFVDIRAELDGLRADLNKANSMMSSQLGQGVKFGKMTAIFSGITAGLTGVMVGFKVLKGVASGIAAPFKLAFKVIKGAASIAIGVIKKAFNGLISIAKSVGRAIQAAFTAGREYVSGAIDVAKDFSEQMSAVGALTATVGTEDFTVLREKALALGSATEFSATQAAEAMANFARTGQSVDEVLASVGPTLDFATANFLDLNTASDIAARVMGGMGLTATEVTRAMDALTVGANKSNQNVQDLGEAMKNVGASAKSAGMDLEDTVGTLMAFADVGRRGGEAGTALKQILLKMPSSQAMKFFNDLGVAAKDATTGGFRPFADIIEDLSAAMSGMDEFEKQQRIVKAFGTRAGPGLTALLDVGADAIRNHTSTIRENAGMAAKNAEVQRGSFANSFKVVASAADDLRIRLVDVLEPLIRGANERAVQALNFLSNFVRTKGPEIRDYLVNAFNTAADAIGNALVLAVGHFDLSVEKMKGLWTSLTSSISEGGSGLGDAVSKFFGQDLMKEGTGPVERVVAAMKTAFVRIKMGFSDVISSISQELVRWGGRVKELINEIANLGTDQERSLEIGRETAEQRRRISFANRAAQAEFANELLQIAQEANERGTQDSANAQQRGEEIVSGWRAAVDAVLNIGTKEQPAVKQAAKAAAEELKEAMATAAGGGAAGGVGGGVTSPASAVAGTISTVFGEMKTGTDQQVVLLKDILATNKLIASNTRSGGMSGFISVGG